MESTFGFLLSLVKIPDHIDEKDIKQIKKFAKHVAKRHNKLRWRGDNLPPIGILDRNSTSQKTGNFVHGGLENNKDVVRCLKSWAKKFPSAIFALHHYHDNCLKISVYTFNDQGILKTDTIDLTKGLKLGAHKAKIAIDFYHTTCQNDMTSFFYQFWNHQFKWKGNLNFRKK
jgi:hypothetical protein